MKRPTFLIAGAPRAGTTFLYEMLDRHPAVYLAKPRQPEPKFFLVDEEYRKGLSYYSATWFAAAPRRAVALGEKSSNYLEGAGVAKRIGESLPDVRLIFVLRDPVERAYSNYLWSRRNGLETLGFAEAVDREAERERSYPPRWRYARPFSYVSRGWYARLLREYLDVFDREQIKVLLFDELTGDPRATYAEILRFLGVADAGLDIDPGSRVNSARDRGEETPPEVRESLRGLYREANLQLAGLLGRDLSHWNL